MDDRTPFRQLALRLRDPIHVKGPATVAGLILALVSGLALAYLDGGVQAAVLGLCWLLIVPASILRGWGMAFFIEHGRGVRRALLELIGGGLFALVACALLSIDGNGVGGAVSIFIFGLVLYGAIFGSLAAGVGLGIGRGGDYMARRIQEADDEGW